RLSRNGCSWRSDNAFLGLSPFFLVSLHLTPSDDQFRRLNMPRLGHRLLWCTALFVGVAVTPLTVQANSVTIFDTFGPGHSRDISAGFGVGSPNGVFTVTSAMAFTPNMTSPLFAIDVAIGSASVPGTQFTLALVTDNAGQPGSLLESWSLTATFLVFCTHCIE